MKEIKDYEWEVQIIGDYEMGYWWQANTKPQLIVIDLQKERKTYEAAQANFVKFAELNSIKKYKFV